MSGGWIDWKGGECPVADDIYVDVILRNGCRDEGFKAGGYYWEEKGTDVDIVKYRIHAGDFVSRSRVRDDTSMTKETNPKDAVGIRKAPLSVVPMPVIAEIGLGMLEGASKYGRHNWRGAGVRSSVYFDATMRHLISFWEGEDIDPDSGMSHIAKALTSLTVWRDAQIQGMCTDDRPPRSKAFYPELNEKAGQIVDKYADKHPKHWTIDDSKEE